MPLVVSRAGHVGEHACDWLNLIFYIYVEPWLKHSDGDDDDDDYYLNLPHEKISSPALVLIHVIGHVANLIISSHQTI